jgi:hypothetical protein
MRVTAFQLKNRWAKAFFQIEVQRGFWLGAVCLIVIFAQNTWAADIHEAEGRTFIVDQTGERWEITQAVRLGFRPEGFQFGIGRNAIRPLDGEDLKSGGDSLPKGSRVIGIASEDSGIAHAYSVKRLTRHEIANTLLGDVPIAAAY